MSLEIQTPKDLSTLKKIILEGAPILFSGSKTSTVIPFDRLLEGVSGIARIVDLSLMPTRLSLDEEGTVEVQGAISWQELRQFLHQKGREIGCWPTDQSALVLSGLATSATGERCFSRGTVRDQVLEINYLDYQANEKTLLSTSSLDMGFKSYQEAYQVYAGFKNAPFPRFEVESDLMIGTEGQLGVITSAKLKTYELVPTSFIHIPTQSWIDSHGIIEYIEFAKNKEEILSFEFFDQKCLALACQNQFSQSDYIVFEVSDLALEGFVEDLSTQFPALVLEDVVILDEKKFFDFRVSIPRGVNEYISHHQLVKKGTDAQVRIENFSQLLQIYREMACEGIDYVLFGHLGDCHLHFNFLPRHEQVERVDQLLEKFYDKILKLKGSPFAEHGIGLIKRKYISRFYPLEVVNTFKKLKAQMDPDGIFFPIGYMGLTSDLENNERS